MANAQDLALSVFPMPAGPSFLMDRETEIPSVWWDGYHFHCYPMANSIPWNDEPGVYVFSRLDPSTGNHQALYIGKAASFSDRLLTHERLAEAKAYGCTHIHALIVRREDHRQDIEQRLIEVCSPPMNTQHNQHRYLTDLLNGQQIRRRIESEIASRYLREIMDQRNRK